MNFVFDLKYALRLMLKSWSYSLLCICVVGLSLGLILWTYAIAYNTVLKPLSFPGSGRWYSIQIAADATRDARPKVDQFTYQEILHRTKDVQQLGAYASTSTLLSFNNSSVSLRGGLITPTLLSATRVVPFLGRIFSDDDSTAGASPVALLSYQAWENYFASDRSIVGRSVRLDGAPVRVIGVLPKNFFAFQDFEVWRPLHLTPLVRPADSKLILAPYFVLGPDQHVGALTDTMQSAVTQVNDTYPNLFNAKRHVELFPAHIADTHSLIQIIAVILLLSLAILVLGCMNISLIFFARFLERKQELALRTALGASRGRLVLQCLLETVLVIVVGLGIGYALAELGVVWANGISEFSSRVMATGRDGDPIAIEGRHLAVVTLIAVALWLFSTLFPAWRLARQDASVALAGTGKGTGNRNHSRTAGLLVGLQVLISSMVLVVCGNLVSASNAEANKPLGFTTDRVMISTQPTSFNDNYEQPSQRIQYWDTLSSAVRTRIPQAEVSFATSLPSQPASENVGLESQEGTARKGQLKLSTVSVSVNYFDLLGIRLLSGRLFDSTDNDEAQPVAVIDEKMARRYWPGQDPLGKRIQLDPANHGPQLTVIGVVSAVAGAPYSTDNGVVYRPIRQATPRDFHILVKLPQLASNAAVTLRAAAYEVDHDLPLQNLQRLDEYLTASSANLKAMVPVFLAIGLITALLAASGLFGLIGRSVAQRTQEVGIRRALGATKWESISMFLWQGGIYLAVGVVGLLLGVIVCGALSQVLTNILANVAAISIGVLVLISLVVFAASYLPSRRAIAIEPGDALRYE